MTDGPTPARDISLGREVALRSAAERLVRDFEGTFNAETVERFLVSSYEQFADRATVTHFLSYTPPLSSPWDPMQQAAHAWQSAADDGEAS